MEQYVYATHVRRRNDVPFFMGHPGILFLEAGNLALHELVELGQLLTPACGLLYGSSQHGDRTKNLIVFKRNARRTPTAR